MLVLPGVGGAVSVIEAFKQSAPAVASRWLRVRRASGLWLPGLGELNHEAVYASAVQLEPSPARDRVLALCVEAEAGQRLREQLAVRELVGVPGRGMT